VQENIKTRLKQKRKLMKKVNNKLKKNKIKRNNWEDQEENYVWLKLKHSLHNQDSEEVEYLH
jgi:hypothetical protein